MALDVSLQLKLTQKLILTPQLQQAIKLLQMPQLELSQMLNQELVENPVLEEALDDYGGDDRELSSIEKQNEEVPESPRDDSEVALDRVGDEADQSFSFSADEYFEDRASDGRDLGYFNPGTDATPTFEQFVSSAPDLTDHLLWQLRLTDVDRALLPACEFVIGNLSDDGYLTVSVEEIAQFCGVSPEQAEAAIAVVQQFDPNGIAARSLQECLLIQLRELGLAGTLADRIIREGMDELTKRNYSALARRFEVTQEQVREAVGAIESLEPRPARNFISTETTYIVPDVYLYKDEDGFRIVLNDEDLPKLRLSRFYRKLLDDKKQLSPEERAFLEEKMRSAAWLLKSLDQRNKTIYRVTEALLRFQKDFFEKGVAHLRPLTLKDVAAELGMHESTISRVTSSKYIQTPDGLLPFRFFFSGAIPSTRDDEGVASTSVKDMIRKIVGEENPAQPYSDQKIVAILKGRGVSIARRTVAKYRDELRIPPQNRRRVRRAGAPPLQEPDQA